ncbi:putative fatty acyl-CoA reductase CG5065 [Hyposmocoma kahamanoa]|uniref:putative fatty acyl-CoA reductase CG5065 n=1 Tax=Hyposmocoma kahamanoa TaxID=1477025 RepID=UPI000E6D923D|nr:putative fatty acyl-CoA reductase CG5065 [Hyposmocoma kahamanoa]
MVSSKTSSSAKIPRFYAGRSIFITGGTGFVGKVLIERLLSTCPDIGKLFLLLRQKKDVEPEKRLLQIKQSPVFDVLRQTNPSQLEKLIIIPGDISLPLLGMSVESLTMLHEVSIVFHSAATVKFDEQLKVAVDQNVRPVIRLLDICDRLPKMEAFIHVSTAYSNSDHETIEERVYPAPAPVHEILALADSAPPHLLNEIITKYISPKPNTYTFTKSIAENVIMEHGNRGYSIAIFRPTIIISSLKYPFPGWIENLNGPSGLAVAAGKGLLHVFSCKFDGKADLLPVDIAADTLIAVGWATAVYRFPEVRVYNCSTIENSTTWNSFEAAIRVFLRSRPLDEIFWYPSGFIVQNEYLDKILTFTLQTLPFYAIEFVSRLLRIQTKIDLIKVDQKLRGMCNVLKFFSMREWTFETTNFRLLREQLSKADAEIYNLDPHSIDWQQLYYNFSLGVRRYLLKEKDQDLEKAKRRLHRMSVLHHGLIIIGVLLFLRFLLNKPLIRQFTFETVRMLMNLSFSTYEKIGRSYKQVVV